MNDQTEKRINSKSYRILSSNWFVTLSATLVGVFVALYLNELVASQKLEEAKANVTGKLMTEVESNLHSMQEAVQQHQKVYDVLAFMSYQDSETGKLIVPFDTIMKFRSEYPNLLSVKDSLLIEEGVYAYSNGSLDFDFQLPQFALSTIAWETLLKTGMSRSYSFECLLYLERIYKRTEQVIRLNDELFNSFYRTADFKADREKILRLLAMLIDHENAAIQALESRTEGFENCS